MNFAQVSDDGTAGLQADGSSLYTYTDAGLRDGAKYWYRMRPFDDDATNGAPLGIWHTTNKVWSVTVLPPPTNLTATSPTAVALTWTLPAGIDPADVRYFYVERQREGSTDWVTVRPYYTVQAGEMPYFTDTTAERGVTYRYRVQTYASTNAYGGLARRRSASAGPSRSITPNDPRSRGRWTRSRSAGRPARRRRPRWSSRSRTRRRAIRGRSRCRSRRPA